MRNRQTFLNDLINFKGDLDELISESFKQPWNLLEGEEPIYLLRQNILGVLERYLSAELTAEELWHWANTVHYRDDLENEIGYDEAIFDVMEHLATEPDFGRPITPEIARGLITEMMSKDYDFNEERL